MNSIEHWIILTFIGFYSISTFVSFVGIPAGITSSAVGLRICVIIAGNKKIKKCKSKKEKEKEEQHDKIVLLAKNKLQNWDLNF